MMRLAVALLSLALFVPPRTGEAQSRKIPLETAKALGLAIPQSVLVRADQLLQ